VNGDPGRNAVDSFLRWAREAIARDPRHWADVEKALADTTMSPELRRVVEAELERWAGKREGSPESPSESADAIGESDPTPRPHSRS
jgi:hypothetical protein